MLRRLTEGADAAAAVRSGTLSRRALGAGAVAAGVALATGCASGDSQRRPAGERRDRVTFLTTFGSQGRDAYSYVAAEKGFFAEAGIDVDIQPGKAGAFNHQQLVAGKADFATVDAAGAMVRYATGADISFAVLAAVHQLTLVGIVTLEGGRISTPTDLAGKTLGTIKGAVPETLFPAYAKLAGFDARSVRWRYAADPAALNTLLAAGSIDGAGLFVVGTPGVEAAAAAAKKPAKALVLPYSQYLTDLYGAVLIAQRSTIDANPDLVRRFTTGLLRGLEYAVTNPQEAGEIMAKRAGQKAPVAAREMELSKPYVIAAGASKVGVLDEARVARMVASLEGNGLIPQGSNPTLPGKLVRFDLAPKA
jgi:NitT/TauT family transport system substrate-binding protein